MSSRETWNGLAYEDGELLRTEIAVDDGYVAIWMSGNLRDDVESVEDLGSVLFFTDKEHFAAWVTGHGAALTPEDVWPE